MIAVSPKRLTWKRAGAALLILAMLAWAGVYALLRSDWLIEQLRLRVIAEVEQATGGVVELEALRFDPTSWALELVNLRVRDPRQDEPFLIVPTASLGISIQSFLSPAVRLNTLRLDRPLVRLDIAEDGSTNWPERVVAEPRLEVADIGLGRLEISQGRIDFNGEPYDVNLSAEEVALSAVLGEGGCYAVDGEAGSLQGAAAGVDLTGAVSGEALLCANSLTITGAELTTASMGTWRVSGSAAPLADPALDFGVSFEAPLDGLVLPLPDPWRIAGSASGSGKLTRAPGEPIAYAGELHAADVDVQGPAGSMNDNHLDAAFAGDLDAVDVSNIRLQLSQAGQITGQARLEGLRDQPLLTGRGTLDGVRLGQLLRTITPRFVWATEATGSFELTASQRDGARISAVTEFSDPGDAQRPGMAGSTDLTYSSLARVLQLRRFAWSAEGVELAASGTLSENGASDFSVDAKAASQADVERLLAIAGYALDPLPFSLDGPVRVIADVSSPAGLSQPSESHLTGEVSTAAMELHGYRWDSLTAQVRFDGGRVTVARGHLIDGAGSADVSGTVDVSGDPLVEWPLDLEFRANGLAIPKLLAAARQTADVQGQLGAAGRLEGTLQDLAARADFRVTQGSALGHPFDSLSGSATYDANRVRVSGLQLRRGPTLVAGAGSFAPAQRSFELQLTGSGLRVEDLPALRERSAPPRGSISFDVTASGVLARAGDSVNFDSLRVDGDWRLAGLEVGAVALGDWSGDAASRDDRIELTLNGAPLNGAVTGMASVAAADLNFTADIGFTNLAIEGLLSSVDDPNGPTGNATGQAKFQGSLRSLSEIQGEGLFSELRMEIADIPGAAEGYALFNPFPMRWVFSDRALRLDHMRLQGEGTNLELTGSVSVAPGVPSDLRIDGNFNLAALRQFQPSLISSGRSRIGVRLTGELSDPEIQGEWVIQDGELQPEDGPIGLSGVNGRVMFVGREFRVEEMRAASGGGILTLSGGGRIVTDDYEFRLDGRAQNVRVRYPTGITSVVDGNFVFSGGGAQRLLSGEVVIVRLTTARTTTLGSLLSTLRSGSPTTAQSAPSDTVQLNVQITSAPGVEINTSLIRNVAADIDLRLVGTLGNPSLLGQIDVSQGEMSFHGSRYQVNRGEIEFRNPIRIEPLLDFELETRMRGVDIALILAGPARRLNVSYRSDPPLSFSDLVNLVAVGRDPTTDPLSASRQRIEQQSLFQTGANNVLAEAVQSPVSPGLQRFFGVSRLKVDPAVGGAEANPAARISTEQQLTDDITLIYTYDLSSSQQQTARLEWTPNRRWTLVVTRDENGLIGSDAIYKTRQP